MHPKFMLRLLPVLMLTFAARPLAACDICGCGAGSYYIGILPEFHKSIAGVRYRYSALTTHIGPGGETSYLTTREEYHTTELWGGWTFRDKIRIMGYVPVSYNTKANGLGRESKSGPGDISVQGYYRPFRSKTTVGKAEKTALLVQDLWIGGGIKLPTGRYSHADKSMSDQSANLFQLGTGSVDFLATLMYDIRLQDLGLNITASYKTNTVNRYDYYYGNRTSGSAQLYYKFRVRNAWMIAPNAGFHVEHSMKDLDAGYSVRSTGGHAGYFTAGTELTFDRITLGGNWQPVVFQELGAGAVRAGNRAMLHCSFLF